MVISWLVRGRRRTGLELVGGGGEGELLAALAGHEAAASYYAAVFEAAEGLEDVSPGGGGGGGGVVGEAAEHDAPAGEELLGHGFGEVFGGELLGLWRLGTSGRGRRGVGDWQLLLSGGIGAHGSGAE